MEVEDATRSVAELPGPEGRTPLGAEQARRRDAPVKHETVPMTNAMVRLLGWKGTVLHGDPSGYDRWKWLRRHLQPGPLRTLDAGCGSGTFTMYAATIGNDTIGVDFNGPHLGRARERAAMLHLSNVRFVETDLRRLDALDDRLGRFDQIICCETIEHIRNDRKLLDDLARLMKPGARLLLTAPFKHYRRLLGDHISEEENGGHVRWGYTHDEMRSLFDSCGLDVVAAEYVSGFVSQSLVNLTRVLGRINGRVAWAAVFPLRALQVLDAPLTHAIRYPHLSVGVIGRRRASV